LILDKIVEATKVRVAQEKEVETPEAVKAAALALPSDTGFPFEAALRQQDFNFICEVKKASPSKGIIAEHFPYLDIAKEYEVAGAAAISVLTEPDFFKGDKKYLQEIASTVKIPVLRKDFIIDEYQIYQAKVWGASAILLICACLDVPTLTKFRELADSLGLSSLVEAHDEQEVQMAIDCGARIIGVNNRNLKDFTVDVQNSVRLRNLVQDDVIFVSESGLETPEDIQVLRDNNIGVALMGETFMRSPNKVKKLAYLYGPTYYTPKVKMCGISKVETIPAVVEAKPDYMGLVFAPSKRQVTVDQAKILVSELHKQYANRYNRDAVQWSNDVIQVGTITDALQEGTATGDAHEGMLTSTENASPTLIHQEAIKTVGVFVNETLDNLVSIATEANLDVVQLHGDEDEAFIQSLKERTNVEVWKAVQIRSAADAEAWIDSSADMLLFDAYHKDERGGTGEVFDWSCLDEFERPFMLAGGIDSTNVARAIRTVRPYGIDISSGIETDGVKDDEKIKAFANIVRTIAMP
jgi:indole-3-glycerol phosphate synthase/phosphoribosylanthranilate isomerase